MENYIKVGKKMDLISHMERGRTSMSDLVIDQ